MTSTVVVLAQLESKAYVISPVTVGTGEVWLPSSITTMLGELRVAPSRRSTTLTVSYPFTCKKAKVKNKKRILVRQNF